MAFVSAQPQPATLTPQWDEGARWTKGPLTKEVQIRVNLLDQDEVVDDLIGVCEIKSDAIADTLAKARVVHVPCGEQTRRQILFLGILAKCNGG